MRPVIGLDFGITNSAIAVADVGKEATLACFGNGTTTSFRSILYFPPKDRSSTVKAETKASPEAISSILRPTPRDDSFSAQIHKNNSPSSSASIRNHVMEFSAERSC